MHSNFNDLKKQKNMTPTEFLQNKNIVAEDKTDLIIGFDNGTKESLIDLLEKYHQAKLKLLGIADVVGRSEQFYCFDEKNKRIDRCVNQCDTCKGLKLMQ